MLKGKHVGLRAIEQSDLSQILEWRNNSKLRRYFRECCEFNMDAQHEWYEKISSEKEFLMFAITRLSDGKMIGVGGLSYIDWVNGSAELPIYIGESDKYIDETFAPDAAKVIIDYAFRELGLHRLYDRFHDFDQGKKKLLENLGFKFEGRLRKSYWAENCWHDSLIYGLIRDDLHLKERYD